MKAEKFYAILFILGIILSLLITKFAYAGIEEYKAEQQFLVEEQQIEDIIELNGIEYIKDSEEWNIVKPELLKLQNQINIRNQMIKDIIEGEND